MLSKQVQQEKISKLKFAASVILSSQASRSLLIQAAVLIGSRSVLKHHRNNFCIRRLKPKVKPWVLFFYFKFIISFSLSPIILDIRKKPISFGWIPSIVQLSSNSPFKRVSPSIKYTFLSPFATALS